MNSRERRKLAALQHNDAIRYEAWLKANAIYSRPSIRVMAESVSTYHRGRQAGMSRVGALTLAKIVMITAAIMGGSAKCN